MVTKMIMRIDLAPASEGGHTKDHLKVKSSIVNLSIVYSATKLKVALYTLLTTPIEAQ